MAATSVVLPHPVPRLSRLSFFVHHILHASDDHVRLQYIRALEPHEVLEVYMRLRQLDKQYELAHPEYRQAYHQYETVLQAQLNWTTVPLPVRNTLSTK